MRGFVGKCTLLAAVLMLLPYGAWALSLQADPGGVTLAPGGQISVRLCFSAPDVGSVYAHLAVADPSVAACDRSAVLLQAGEAGCGALYATCTLTARQPGQTTLHITVAEAYSWQGDDLGGGGLAVPVTVSGPQHTPTAAPTSAATLLPTAEVTAAPTAGLPTVTVSLQPAATAAAPGLSARPGTTMPATEPTSTLVFVTASAGQTARPAVTAVPTGVALPSDAPAASLAPAAPAPGRRDGRGYLWAVAGLFAGATTVGLWLRHTKGAQKKKG